MSRSFLGNKTVLASANDGATTESWHSAGEFVGLDGGCTIKAYGTWGGATLVVQIADDASGTGATDIVDASFTANGAKKFSLSPLDYVRVVTSGGTESELNVTATPHGRR